MLFWGTSCFPLPVKLFLMTEHRGDTYIYPIKYLGATSLPLPSHKIILTTHKNFTFTKRGSNTWTVLNNTWTLLKNSLIPHLGTPQQPLDSSSMTPGPSSRTLRPCSTTPGPTQRLLDPPEWPLSAELPLILCFLPFLFFYIFFEINKKAATPIKCQHEAEDFRK